MRKFAALVAAATLTIFAAPASATYDTTTTTAPHCGDGHGDDAGHNPHCDESTTTTTAEESTTTTFIVELPSNPTTTTTRPPFVAPTTTTVVTAPPHIDVPAVTDAPTTTTTTMRLLTDVAGTHEAKKLPTTGAPIAFLLAVGLLCLLVGGAALYVRHVERVD